LTTRILHLSERAGIGSDPLMSRLGYESAARRDTTHQAATSSRCCLEPGDQKPPRVIWKRTSPDLKPAKSTLHSPRHV